MTKADADLAARSEKFHAYEWLRGLALAGHRHAQAIMDEGGVLDAIREEGRQQGIEEKHSTLNIQR